MNYKIDSVIHDLKSLCEINTQKRIAKKFGLSPSYINDVLQRKREPGEKLLRELGYKKIIRYEILK